MNIYSLSKTSLPQESKDALQDPIDRLKRLQLQKQQLLTQSGQISTKEMETIVAKLNMKIHAEEIMIMQQINKMTPSQKYESTKRTIQKNLKQRDYWPDGMEHPENYRGFFWTDDLAFCGFATASRQ